MPVGIVQYAVVPDIADLARRASALAQSLSGREEGEAAARVEHAGLIMRIVERDGERYSLRRDYRTNRINGRVTGGKISAAGTDGSGVTRWP